jgi:radical SAM superfamily enzyme YgiQ (UPF0313 family)
LEIVLVKPCWQYPIAGADHTYNRRWPPLELLNCAALLEADGHRVRIVDAQAERLAPQQVAARVGKVDLICVTSSALDRWQCPTLELAPLWTLVEHLRPCSRQLVLLGFHGTVQPEEMLIRSGVDAVVRGEPEPTVRELAAGGAWERTLGLTFLRDGRPVSTADRPDIDLTTLPVPAFHLIDPRHYQYEILGPRFLVLEGVRGCPWPCTFCSRVIQGKRLRRKTAAQLGREVEIAVRQFGVRNLYFIDLEFTASAELVRGLCEHLLAERIAVRWCCQTRADLVDEPLLRLMKRAGCRLIHYGVESGSPRILELSRKHTTLEQQRAGVRLTQRLGIETLCFFLLGYPGETAAEMQQTIRFARELNPTYASFHRISPYPGTPLYDQFAPGSGELFPAFAGADSERRHVDHLVRKAIWSYYMRPGYVVSRLLHASPRSLWRQLRLFAGYF